MLETTEKDKAYDKLRSAKTKSEAAKKVLRGAGYARGGGVGAITKPKYDKRIPKKHGGKVAGEKPKARPDKYARGGSAPRGHGMESKGHTKIAINVGAGQQEKQQAMQQGMQIGAKMAAAKLAGAGGPPRPGAGAPMQARPMPPMGGAPGGAPMPPPGGGGVPPTMANRGGRFAKGGKVGPAKVKGVTNIREGGAGGAAGRLEKIKKYGGKKN